MEHQKVKSTSYNLEQKNSAKTDGAIHNNLTLIGLKNLTLFIIQIVYSNKKLTVTLLCTSNSPIANVSLGASIAATASDLILTIPG